MSQPELMRIGVLIPEFPTQTRAFFWREVRALRGLGVVVRLLSTRRPPADACRHTFAAAARAETHYLFPPGLADVWGLARRPFRTAAAVGYVLGLHESGMRAKLCCLGLFPSAARLARHARRHNYTHVHVHSCGDAAHLAALGRLLGGPTYSLTLHGPLRDYGSDQRAKWRRARFAFVITDVLADEVRRQLSSDMPDTVQIYAHGRRSGPPPPCLPPGKGPAPVGSSPAVA